MAKQEQVKRAVIYARCSTDEKRQDVENQLKELRRYCEAFNWPYDEVHEYESGYKGMQPRLQEVLEHIRRKKYDAFLVYSLDRFSLFTGFSPKSNRFIRHNRYSGGFSVISWGLRLDPLNRAMLARKGPFVHFSVGSEVSTGF